MSPVPPIRQQVTVAADPSTAFAVFTDGLGRWWPIAGFSVHGAEASVAFVDGEIVERSPAGDRELWGTVTRWEPGVALGFTWHPGGSPERATQVEVTFEAAGPATLVTLEHRGWEVLAEGEQARNEYDKGWPTVLGHYVADFPGVASDPSGDGETEHTWVALLHRPGPAAPQEGSIFADPRFGDHVAFLERMHEAGYLVAAGPLGDAEGEGMTVLRLPGGGQLDKATKLATEDDASVAGGFFSVTVRPWDVMLRG